MLTHISCNPIANPIVVPNEAGNCETSDRLAEALAIKFEELSIIYQLTERLQLEESPSSICISLLEQLATCIQSVRIGIVLYADEELSHPAETFLTGEPMSLDQIEQIAQLVRESSDTSGYCDSTSFIANSLKIPSGLSFQADETEESIRVIIVPIERKTTCLGYMIATRSIRSEEFGTVEADLMRSTMMMLAVHLINQRQYLEMQQMFEGTVRSLVSALDAKDTYTCGHSSRVAEVAVELATKLGYDEQSLARIRMAGILHDIGKIGVEDSVLRKPGKLTDEEFDQIKQHPVLGYEILKGIKPFRNILPAVRHHHESWDGTGYPDGLAGESIPRDAQVIAVADAFDAMSSDRPYRPGMPIDRVIDIFRKGRGQQWAADVVDVLFECEELLEEAKKH
jgi:putative nucleotidyltransferase with HDIG domain